MWFLKLSDCSVGSGQIYQWADGHSESCSHRISAEGRARRLGPRQFMRAGKTRDQGEGKAKRAWDARDKCPVLGSSGSDQEPTPPGYRGTLLCASDVPRHTVQEGQWARS